jgi:perosamine synthetase
MVTANDDQLALHFRKLRGQGLAKDREYWHDTLGFNFRMTNICAGIGAAQLQNAAGILARKRAIADFYQKSLHGTPLTCHTETLGTTHSFWMCSVLARSPKERDDLRDHLKARKIETRPFFYPVHQMPMYSSWNRGTYPGAEDAAYRGINLPSYPSLTYSQLERVRDCLVDFYQDRAT